MTSFIEVKKVLKKNRKKLLKKDLTAVGIGYKIVDGKRTGDLCMVCSVAKKKNVRELSAKKLIPNEIKGVKTDVVETGVIKALHTERHRPAIGGISVGHACYDDQTKVLTNDGLKFFKDIKITDKIATLKDDQELEYQHPTKMFQYAYSGNLIHFQGRTIDLMVTPNHNIYYRNRYKRKSFELETAETVLQNNAFASIQFKRNCTWNCSVPCASFTIPAQTEHRIAYEAFMLYDKPMTEFVKEYDVAYKTVCRWKHNLFKPGVFKSQFTFAFDDWLEFMGWYLSEGSSFANHCQGTVTIAEKSGRHHREITDLLKRMKINSCITSEKAIQFAHKELALYLKQFGTAKKKYIPGKIKDLPPDKLKIILDSLMKGDGHFENGRYRHYKTVSWQLANDVFEIALKCGYGVTIQQEMTRPHKFGNRIIKRGIAYKIGFSHTKLTPRLAKEPEIVPYKGEIYCLEVPNHVIFVERKGKTCWSGNSITAGTLGCVVRKAGTRYLLSNSHVLAMSGDADIGDDILQPGAHDGGTLVNDHFAELSAHVPINFSGVTSECPISELFITGANRFLQLVGSKTCLLAVKQAEANLVDAAIAQPLIDTDLSDEIMEIGKIKGSKTAILGMKIKKSGRTTGLTTGEITQVDVTVRVQYGEGKIAEFSDQIMAGKMCEGGDSGSAVLTDDNYIVGLLFAGSDTSMIASRIENVFELLGIDL